MIRDNEETIDKVVSILDESFDKSTTVEHINKRIPLDLAILGFARHFAELGYGEGLIARIFGIGTREEYIRDPLGISWDRVLQQGRDDGLSSAILKINATAFNKTRVGLPRLDQIELNALMFLIKQLFGADAESQKVGGDIPPVMVSQR